MATRLSWDGMRFYLAPTEPPSTSLWVTGGWAWEPAWWGPGSGNGNFVPAVKLGVTRDLVATAGYAMAIRELRFSQPFWYSYLHVGLYRGGWYGPPYYLYVYGQFLYYYSEPSHNIRWEWETAEEAEEAALAAYASTPYPPYQSHIPLGILITRNNGRTGIDLLEIQPIDAVNRGRSYIFLNRYHWPTRYAI